MRPDLELHVDIASQRLSVESGGEEIASYPVSTARNGAGEQDGSFCTPRGRHRVAEKFGGDAPLNAVFVGRAATGETWSPELAIAHPDRDWILTRILWLEGTEDGFNRGGAVDSRQRYIYIHGTPDSEPMGEPASHGCIRMRNADVVELFDFVPVGCPVIIHERRFDRVGEQ
ncbi:MAG: L,D-transpeptidase [Gammaproteobacteria bacterium]|nr:L,D-transpeptidase [Gammaproteobacteria bacterium]